MQYIHTYIHTCYTRSANHHRLNKSRVGHADCKDEEGYTPLILAAHYGQTAMVAALLASHANPDIAARDGSNALICAVQGGHLDSVNTLITSGADVNANSRHKEFPSPLYTAAQEGHSAITRVRIHSLTHSLTHSHTHTFTFTHSLTHSLTH